MKLSLNNANFSLEGLKIENVCEGNRFYVSLDKEDFESFKTLVKVSGLTLVNFDLLGSTPYRYIVKIKVPNSWVVKITM